MDKEFNGIVIIIYSCKKNYRKSRLLYTLIKSSLIDIKIHILNGTENIENDYLLKDEIIYVKCKDNYDSLYLKTQKLFKEIINIYPKIKGILKIDDDIIPNNIFLRNTITYFLNSSIHYCGKVSVILHPNVDYHHIEKCEEMINKRPLKIPPCTYCSGPCYYISSEAIKYLNNNIKLFFSEDIMVGLTLCETSIYKPLVYPLYYNDKSYKWITNIQNFKDKSQHDYLTFIRIRGGLGNQIFQLACGIEYCNKNNSLPILIYDDKWLKMNKTLNTLFKKINRINLNDFKDLNINYKIIKPENNFLDKYKFTQLPGIKDNNVLLDGYFQNINYCKNIQDELYEIIVDKDYIDLVETKYVNIKNDYFIHIGKKNDKKYEIDYDKYFDLALNMIMKWENKKINLNIISNNIEYCKSYEILNKFKDKINLNFIENSDEIESFYIMILCKGGITSNSSYSWWGSYINKNNNKKIIMPNKWLNGVNIDMSIGPMVLRL
jgi:hypothetical protein